MTFDFAKLTAPFDPASVHFRAQSLTRDGKKAMALAYLDARDVMDRLDEACGPANWQTEYFETAKGRLICRLSINIEGAWITKSDGAGNTDIEGEKGAISDALKRAAVSWGVGRYLYRLGDIWVPCESYEKNGKLHWKKWTVDPWKVANLPEARIDPDAQDDAPKGPSALGAPADNAAQFEKAVTDAIASIKREKTMIGLSSYFADLYRNMVGVASDPRVVAAKDARKAELVPKPAADLVGDSIPY